MSRMNIARNGSKRSDRLSYPFTIRKFMSSEPICGFQQEFIDGWFKCPSRRCPTSSNVFHVMGHVETTFGNHSPSIGVTCWDCNKVHALVLKGALEPMNGRLDERQSIQLYAPLHVTRDILGTLHMSNSSQFNPEPFRQRFYRIQPNQF